MRSHRALLAGLVLTLGIPPGGGGVARADDARTPLAQEVRQFLSREFDGFASRLTDFIQGVLARQESEEIQRLQSQLAAREDEVRRLEDEVLRLRCRVSELEVQLALSEESEPVPEEAAAETPVAADEAYGEEPGAPSEEPIWTEGEDSGWDEGAETEEDAGYWEDPEAVTEPELEPEVAPAEEIPAIAPEEPAPEGFAPEEFAPEEPAPEESEPAAESPAPAPEVPAEEPSETGFWERYVPWLERASRYREGEPAAEPGAESVDEPEAFGEETPATPAEGEGAGVDAQTAPEAEPADGPGPAEETHLPAWGDASGPDDLPQHDPSLGVYRDDEGEAETAEASAKSAPESEAPSREEESAPASEDTHSPEDAADPVPSEAAPPEAPSPDPSLPCDPNPAPPSDSLEFPTD